MNRRLLASVITCVVIASVGGIFAQAPAQPGQGGRGAGKGGQRPANPATPEDLADIAKLANLPALAPGAGDGDFSIGPDYTPAPEEKQRVGIPHGKLIEFFMNSTSSKVFPGDVPFDRLVSVYIPAQYDPGKPAPFIFSADSYGVRDRQLANILDNMIADRRLPVMVAVMVANGPGPERSLEYDTVSPVFADFVETEILPRVEKETGVTLTKDPEGRMSYGGSSGGAMALTMAWYRNERYHRVLSYSGTFVDLREGPGAPHAAYEYPEHFFPDNPVKPIRIWMHVSENDIGATSASADRRNWVIANQRLAGVLKAKGYHYQFVYAKNAGHVDAKVIHQTLPQALEYVWKDYPISGK
jgi:enterochelin esterase family protein